VTGISLPSIAFSRLLQTDQEPVFLPTVHKVRSLTDGDGTYPPPAVASAVGRARRDVDKSSFNFLFL
jgi:hypothetical protein